MSGERFKNARIVLADKILSGTLEIENGLITSIALQNNKAGLDFEGDFLIPGLIELHTDHWETHLIPRPKIQWNHTAAIQSHDLQLIGSGITTVFNALRIGMYEDMNLPPEEVFKFARTLLNCKKQKRLKADHFIHLRCEVSSPDAVSGFDLFKGIDEVKLVSFMDHTPGQRQFTTFEAYKQYYQGKTGLSDDDFSKFAKLRKQQYLQYSSKHREMIYKKCQSSPIIIASHDDATKQHIEEAVKIGVSIAEFPTTLEAANIAREKGLKVLLGAPNVVRGGSHSGNISVTELAKKNLVDMLSSDYVPSSLLHSIFLLVNAHKIISLPEGITMISKTPAEVMGLKGRGEIKVGYRADFIRCSVIDNLPIVKSVWRYGQRMI